MKWIAERAILLVLVIFVSCKEEEKVASYNELLWYNYPATYWNSQALHLGNSYFGASFFGGVEEEKFALTEKSMWTGGPANGNWEKAGVNPKALETLPAIREAVISEKAQLADSLITNNFFGSSELFGSFTSIGNLNIKFFDHDGQYENYRRSLDLKTSTGQVSYTVGGITYNREYFCSYPDKVMAARFTADSPAKVSFSLYMKAIHESYEVDIDDDMYRLSGQIDGNQRPFEVSIQVRNQGGTVRQDHDSLIVNAADEVELYLTIATNYAMKYPDYQGENPRKRVDQVMQNINTLDFRQLKENHEADYQGLYNRVAFQLEEPREVENLSTNERFQRLKNGMADPGYKVLAFNLGRYMIISSSRPNSLPANLQGVWNAFKVSPWSGNYQSNINLQEIYWSCGPTNLLECQEAYIDWIEDMAISGKEVAQRVYGSNGWVSHTTGNIWGHAAPMGDHPWGMYPMGAAWHCQHVWDQYAFSGDVKYLQEQGYPLLKEASIFWLENLIPFEGYLITAPTVSAEHGALMTENGLNPAFHDFESDRYHYSLPGVYQDIEMIWDLFTNTSEAALILGESDFADSLLKVREKLLPLKIGQHGQLQEWYYDIDHPDGHHRHISHLYAVSPGIQIHPTTTPDLAKAAKKSLNMRGDGRYLEQELASGGNWSRAHRMWCWVRLMDGNRTNKILTEILTEQGFENVLTFQHAAYHWNRQDFQMEGDMYLHYQLDASASIPGAIAEMLLQSHLDEIHLLPALPDEFHSGKISGIKARGGYIIDLEWEDKKLVKASIYTDDQDVPQVRLVDQLIDINDDPRITFIRKEK